ncbi:MAG: hydroxymethylbilane synthase, partial [Thermoleophilia bacterium]|nr:hydroxymethylbilane synthase [Thermoleophilia bacterium]
MVLATRRSPLALAQTEFVAAALTAAGHEVELLPLTTTGDRWSASGTGAAPDKGLFVKELEEALLDGRAHLAVHSAKDLPGELPAGLAVLAVPAREDARDVLVGPPGGLAGLPAGATVATGSPRRAAQVLAARPDLRVVPIRGNVGTRLDKLARGDADALVIAAAGLRRLGLTPDGTTPLPVEISTPAPGQGLLALQGRADDPETAAAVAVLDDPAAHACLRAERALLAALGGGCLQPVGAYCAPHGEGLRIVAFAGALINPDFRERW